MAIFKVVAQNFDLLDESSIAQTGKITCDHLFKVNASGTLIGHPEINEDLQKSSDKIEKIIALQNHYPSALPFNVIFIGEDFTEFSNFSLSEIAQLMKDRCFELFKNIPDEFIRRMLLIYEPKWIACSNRNQDVLPPSTKMISRVTNKMRDFLLERVGSVGYNVSLMYGEITTSERAIEILANENLQGSFFCASISDSLGKAPFLSFDPSSSS